MRAVAVVRAQGRGQLTLPASFRKAGHFEARVLSRRSLLDFPQVDAEAVMMGSAREEMGRALAEDATDAP